MSKSKIGTLTDKELYELENKIHQAMLGTDNESRRLMQNFLSVIKAEKKKRLAAHKAKTQAN